MSVAKLYVGAYFKRWFSSEGEEELSEFFRKRGRDKAFCRVGDKLSEATSLDDCKHALEAGGDLYCVTPDPWKISCLWRGDTRDGVETFVKLAIQVTPKFDDAKFWNEWEPRLLTTRANGGVLEEEEVQARIVDVLGQRALQFLSGTTYANLENSKSEDFWRYQLEEALGNLGLAWHLGQPAKFLSPTKEKEQAKLDEIKKANEALKDRETEQKLRFEARRQALQSDLDNKRLSQKYEIALRRLEEQNEALDADLELSAIERQTKKLEVAFVQEKLKKEHELELLKLEQAIKLEQERPERERAEREREHAEREQTNKSLEGLGGAISALAQGINSERQESNKSLEEINGQIAALTQGMNAERQEMKETLVSCFKQINDAFASQPTTINVALESFSKEILESVGLMQDPRYFNRLYSRRFDEVKNKFGVALEAKRMTRDATYKMRPQTAELGQAFQLKFRAPMDGYATILNLGTSGAYLLLVPNGPQGGGVAPEAAKVASGNEYVVPGSPLYNGGLYEGGPCGWEEFVVIITKNKPLFADSERFNVNDPESPFAQLGADRLKRVLDALDELDPDDFAMGKVGFTVVERAL